METREKGQFLKKQMAGEDLSAQGWLELDPQGKSAKE
jgi:hypothetical protein